MAQSISFRCWLNLSSDTPSREPRSPFPVQVPGLFDSVGSVDGIGAPVFTGAHVLLQQPGEGGP
jgi:hypothetical protein